MSDLTTQLVSWNKRFEGAEAGDTLQWMLDQYGDELVATSSFQTQSVPLLHLISRFAPKMKIYFLDTGFHFDETIHFVERIKKDFGLKIEYLKPLLGHEEFQEQYGDLFEKDPSMCCYLNKVEPLTRALKNAKAWISGVRSDQTSIRAGYQKFNLQGDGKVKCCPLINWTQQQIDEYIVLNNLPSHPLLSQGYRSIGCAPCTKPVDLNDDARAGRWVGIEKTECGLHGKNPSAE